MVSIPVNKESGDAVAGSDSETVFYGSGNHTGGRFLPGNHQRWRKYLFVIRMDQKADQRLEKI